MRQRPGHPTSRLKNNTRYSIYTYLWTGHGPYSVPCDNYPGIPHQRCKILLAIQLSIGHVAPTVHSMRKLPESSTTYVQAAKYFSLLYHTFTPSQCLIGHVSCWIGCATTTRVSHIQVAKNLYSLYTLYTYCLLMGHRGSIYCSEACGNYFYPSIPHPGCKIFTRYQYIYLVHYNNVPVNKPWDGSSYVGC